MSSFAAELFRIDDSRFFIELHYGTRFMFKGSAKQCVAVKRLLLRGFSMRQISDMFRNKVDILALARVTERPVKVLKRSDHWVVVTRGSELTAYFPFLSYTDAVSYAQKKVAESCSGVS